MKTKILLPILLIILIGSTLTFATYDADADENQNTDTEIKLKEGAISNTKRAQKERPERSETPETQERNINNTIQEGLALEGELYEKIYKIIDDQQEIMTAFSLPQDPNNPNLVLVSSYKTDSKSTTDLTNKIYKYNTETNTLEKIFEVKNGEIIRIIGIIGEKLILIQEEADNSPGPCYTVWNEYITVKTLDLNNPAELKQFTIPETQLEKGKAELEQCMKEMTEEGAW